MSRRVALAVLVSGEGTLFEAIARSSESGTLPCRMVGMVSDREGIPAVDKARAHHVPSVVLPMRGIDPRIWAEKATGWLTARSAELVLLAGFRSILPSPFVAHWAGRVINIHPSLLPAFGGSGMYGEHVHRAVLHAGVPETGVTLHLVTDDVDRGPALLQERLAVAPADTPLSLRDRLRPLEVGVLEEAIRRFSDGRWPLPYAVTDPTTGARPPA